MPPSAEIGACYQASSRKKKVSSVASPALPVAVSANLALDQTCNKISEARLPIAGHSLLYTRKYKRKYFTIVGDGKELEFICRRASGREIV